MFVEDVAPQSTESGLDIDETWDLIDEIPVVVSSDSLSSDKEGYIANSLVSWINKHQIKQSC